MNKWIPSILAVIFLTACGKAEEPKEKVQHKANKPDIEVTVKPPKETANKEQKSEKESKQNKSKSGENVVENKDNQSTQEVQHQTNHMQHQSATATTTTLDSEKYNLARECLITSKRKNDADCQSVGNTREFSKAWNNLTAEGYICKSGRCSAEQEESTEDYKVNNKAPVTNEQRSNVPIATEVIPAKSGKSSEEKGNEPTTEDRHQIDSEEESTNTGKDRSLQVNESLQYEDKANNQQ